MSLSRLADLIGAARAASGNESTEPGASPHRADSLTLPPTLLPTDNNWSTSMLAGTTTHDESSSYINYSVKMPASRAPRLLRDELLRQCFGYTKADTNALDHAPDSPGFYLADRNHMERPATLKEAKAWPIRPDGTIEVPVTATKARELERFLATGTPMKTRAHAAVAGITDPAIRARVESNLLQLAATTGEQRIRAAIKLSTLAQPNEPHANDILAATRSLADQPGCKTNAALRLALARMSVASNPQQAKNLTWDAIKLASGHDPSTNFQRPGVRVDRAEAALVNQYAAQIFHATGDEYQAQQREMIGRFYEADDLERAQSPEGGRIERWKSDTNGTRMMRATTPAERGLREFNAPHASQAEVANTDTTSDVDNNSAKFRTPDRYYGTEFDNNGRPRPIVDDGRSRGLDTESAARGGGVGAAVSLIDEVNKWTPVIADLYYGTSANHTAGRQRLEEHVVNESHYFVPPKPERLQRMVTYLENERREARTPQSKQQAEEKLRAFTTALEASHAYWNR